jgi:hypothetical protein
VSRPRSRTGAVISRAESWARGAPISERVSRFSPISGPAVGGGAEPLGAFSSRLPRIAHQAVPERSNGAVSRCAWRRPACLVPSQGVRFSAAFSPVAVASFPARSCPVLGRSVPIRVPNPHGHLPASARARITGQGGRTGPSQRSARSSLHFAAVRPLSATSGNGRPGGNWSLPECLFAPLPLPTCRRERAEAELGDEGTTPAVSEQGCCKPAGRLGVGCSEEATACGTAVQTLCGPPRCTWHRRGSRS